MIAFGVAVTDRATYERCAARGIERAAEPDSALIVRRDLQLWRAYDEIIDEAAGHPELEALVLLHQDLELTDDSLPARVRRVFGDPRVGLLGSLGARNVTLHLWLASRELYGTVASPEAERRFSSGTCEVEGVDGALLVLAPWVVRALRFGVPPAADFHGYDAELSLRVRAHGGRVICDDVPYFHHRRPKTDFDAQRRTGIELANRWSPDLRPREWAGAFQL